MKKVLTVVAFALLLALFVSGITSAAPKPTRGRLRMGNRVYNVNMIVANRTVYVNCNQLSGITRMPLKSARGNSVYFGRTLVPGVVTYNRVKYVNAASFANRMGYKTGWQSSSKTLVMTKKSSGSSGSGKDLNY